MQNAGDEHACLWMCFVHAFVCVCECVCTVVMLCRACVKMCVQVVECMRVYISTCVQICRYTEVSVKVCLSMMMEREGSLSFNIVLLEHWTICECAELTAETQSSLVHPPTSSTPFPPSLPLPAYPPWLTAHVFFFFLKQRHRHGPGRLSGAMSSSQCFYWWWALNMRGWRGMTAPSSHMSTSQSALPILACFMLLLYEVLPLLKLDT